MEITGKQLDRAKALAKEMSEDFFLKVSDVPLRERGEFLDIFLDEFQLAIDDRAGKFILR